ncbi:type IV pilus biogenesis protein PilM [Pseudomonas aegrilactucae]|uniref:Pilus assembly protein PilM n=1 Tax=Pseudomonas aegrilactucae TaxID=2854028 RepID=A0A9Q3AEX9_9PSED|nr:pilus assembly protein PilM [Pseudomonas aegrilactucae]MBV6289155.1 pilus assembly protein PilM [Pseudomonas aegrilactucae]
MFGRFGKDAGSLLGIDISAHGIRLLQRRRACGTVSAWATEPVAAGVLHEGRVVDPERLAHALGQAFARSGATCREAGVAVPASAVLSKVLRVPAGLTPDALFAHVRLEAEAFIPFAMEDAALDFECLGRAAQDPACEAVCVHACHQNWVDGLEAAVELAGLRARVVESDSLALQRAAGLESGAVLQVEAGHLVLHVLAAHAVVWRGEAVAATDLPHSLAECVDRWLLALDGVMPSRLVLAGAAATAGQALYLQRQLGLDTTLFGPAPPTLALAYGLAARCAP